MLEGLEISEVKYSELVNHTLSFRMDSEFFKKGYLKQDTILAKKSCSRLGSIVNKIDVGFVGAMTLHYREEGVDLLQTKNIKSFFVEDTETTKITPDFHQTLKKSQIHYEDVLIARSGSFGKASLYLKKETINSSDIIIIEANEEKVSPYYLTGFLNSNFGVEQMIRFASGGLQGHVNLTILEELLVPDLSEAFQRFYRKLIIKSYSSIEEYIHLYSQAETLLLKEIGMVDGDKNNVNIKPFSQSFQKFGRLDAEYYQTKYEEFEQAIISYAKGHTTIGKEFEHIKNSADRTKAEYRYVEIGDINVGDGSSSYTIRTLENLPANAKTEAKKGDLLVSNVRPNRGAVSIIDFDDANLIVSGAFTVLRQKQGSEFSNEMLKVLLRTPIYKEWMLKFNIGTQYPVIRDEDILELPIPRIPKEIQNKISVRIKESQLQSSQSESLLDIAKRGVEMAIEQDENTAENWIVSECQKLGIDFNVTINKN